jgi:hypothetical protein
MLFAVHDVNEGIRRITQLREEALGGEEGLAPRRPTAFDRSLNDAAF